MGTVGTGCETGGFWESGEVSHIHVSCVLLLTNASLCVLQPPQGSPFAHGLSCHESRHRHVPRSPSHGATRLWRCPQPLRCGVVVWGPLAARCRGSVPPPTPPPLLPMFFCVTHRLGRAPEYCPRQLVRAPAYLFPLGFGEIMVPIPANLDALPL